MLKNIAMLLTTLVLALSAMHSFAIAPGAAQAQMQNNMQQMQQNKQQMQQNQQNMHQKKKHSQTTQE